MLSLTPINRLPFPLRCPDYGLTLAAAAVSFALFYIEYFTLENGVVWVEILIWGEFNFYYVFGLLYSVDGTFLGGKMKFFGNIRCALENLNISMIL